VRPLTSLSVLLFAAACSDPTVEPSARSPGTAQPAAPGAASPGTLGSSRLADAEAQATAARCTSCHTPSDAVRARIPALPSPDLSALGTRVAGGFLEEWLTTHFAPDPETARDLAHFLTDATGPSQLAPVRLSSGAIARGERLWRQMACAACHRTNGIAHLAAKTDVHNLAAGLQAGLHAAVPHDFGLDPGESSALAAWLLREQADDTAVDVPEGLAWECFHLRIQDGEPPALDGLTPAARGITDRITTEHSGDRDNHYALRFRGEVLIPAAGTWGFVLGSDDGSWLHLDGQLVVANGGIKPHQRRRGERELTAGWHDIEVVFTQAAGGASLELLWAPPGATAPEPIPAGSLSTATSVLVPPAALVVDAQRAARGERAFAAARCNSCHQTAGLPAAAPAPAWSELADAQAACPHVDQPGDAHQVLAADLAAPRSDAEELTYRLRRDRCTACHERKEGATTWGGLRREAADLLEEIEDLGDEGRLPPALTEVGHRLRKDWIAAVIRGDERIRHYMTARMPILPPGEATAYAELFAKVDPRTDADVEPPFSEEAAELGRELAGADKLSCITCHSVADHPSLGAQGMDLARQHERLRPAWFKEWILAPNAARPGTRMPTFWGSNDPAASDQADALRVWMSLGGAMPLPPGIQRNGRGLMLSSDGRRPVLHGAFLDGLSARCIAVGSPQRTHFAYDLAHRRLAWLWRGDFLDASGTWDGRAGSLLRPAGQDWVRLPPGETLIVAGADGPTELLGWDVDDEGYPIFRLRRGAVELRDAVRPGLRSGGSVIVRTLTAIGGAARVLVAGSDGDGPRAFLDDQQVSTVDLSPDTPTEIEYRW